MTDEPKESQVLEELKALDARMTRLEAGLHEEKRVAAILHGQLREEIGRNRDEATRRHEDLVSAGAARHQEVLSSIGALKKDGAELQRFKEQLTLKVGVLWMLFGAAVTAAVLKMLSLS